MLFPLEAWLLILLYLIVATACVLGAIGNQKKDDPTNIYLIFMAALLWPVLGTYYFIMIVRSHIRR